jgi:hypothetical protein
VGRNDFYAVYFKGWGRICIFYMICCFCSSSKQRVQNEGVDNATTAIIAADSTKLDSGGRVVAGEYVPTKDEVLHHKQVEIRMSIVKPNILLFICYA